jgi:DNA polymerase I
LKFITHLPPPIEVTESNIDEAFEDCWYYDQMIGVDTETLGKGYLSTHDQLVCTSFSPRTETRYFVPRRLLRSFQPLLERQDVTWAIFNAKFDAHRFANMGITLGGRWADGNVLDWLIDEDQRENRHGLKECANDYLGIPTKTYGELFGKDKITDIVPGHPKYDLFVDYAALDAWLHRELCLMMLDQLSDIVKWHDKPKETLAYQYWYEEEPQLQTLWKMERRGLFLDTALLSSMAKKVEIDMDLISAKLNGRLGRPFNPASTPQKQALLFGPPPLGLGLTPRGKTDSGQPSTDSDVLEFFAGVGVEVCRDLLDHSELNKLKGYVVGLPKHLARDGRVHTKFSPTKVTGRLSSAEPNLQNIPTKANDKYGIRAALIAPTDMGEEYVLIVADYAQLEMRILADISGDEAMIEGILAGLDMHVYTAARMNGMPYDEFNALIKSAKAKDKKAGEYRDAKQPIPDEYILTEREEWATGMRSAAKSIGFGIVYGITEHGLAVQLTAALKRPVTKDEALELIEKYLDTFPGVRAYMHTTQETAKISGSVQTYRGRFRHLSKARSRNKYDVLRALRQAINARIQGSAADIVKRAMLYCEGDAELRVTLKCELVLQVHDELIFQCPRRTAAAAMAIIQPYMEHPFTKDLKVPLTAEPAIVTRWSDAK